MCGPFFVMTSETKNARLPAANCWQAGELKSASRLPHSHTPQDRNYLVGTCCLSVSLVGLVAVFAVGNRSRIHGLCLSVQSIRVVVWWFWILTTLLCLRKMLLAEPADFAGDGVPASAFFWARMPGNSSASNSVYSSWSLHCAAMSEVCSLTISCAWKKFKTGSAYLALKGVRMMPPRPKFSSIQWPSFSVCPALAKGARSWLI